MKQNSGGHLSIHPLIKCYDEAHRGAERLRKHLNINGKEMTEESKDTCQAVIQQFEQAIKYIPDEYRLNTYELRKLYAEGRKEE